MAGRCTGTGLSRSGGMLVGFVALSLAACGGDDPIATGDAVPGAADVISLEQGWSEDTQDRAWFASFGSRMIPYAWFLELEKSASGERFGSAANLAALGFLPQTPTENNPDGLPVGFSRDQDENGVAWVGLTCAACHTGEVHYRGAKIRIDGGQSLIDFTAFESGLIDALSATVADGEKFDRFARGVIARSGDRAQDASLTLKAGMTARTEALAARRRMNATAVPYGPGRLDAFGQIFNAAAVEFLGEPGNRRAPDAPVSYPVLWSAPHLDVVQWNGSAPNAGPGPLFQNITTALAVYGQIDMTPDAGAHGYKSSVDFANLGKIQNWLYELKSPLWPAGILGEPDLERVRRGAALYAAQCESCHTLSDREDPQRKLNATLTPVDAVGTDPRMARNFIDAKARSGFLQGKKTAYVGGDVMQEQTPTINIVVHAAMGAALRHPLKSALAALEDYHSVVKAKIDTDPDYYKARSLDGIWASAPYLHNGSVPSLDDLLKPATQRPTRFPVGGHEFDPLRVGLSQDAAAHRAVFDTGLAGNSNAGHDYGTQLTGAEREDLIEYLKTL